MNRLRQLHLVLGVFFAPCILFFAFSGALQTLGLHERGDRPNYRPPEWIKTLANIHKDQRLSPHEHEHSAHAAEAPKPEAADDEDHDAEEHHSWALKFFVLTMTVGLMTTTL